jgi:hypothetical protein
LKARAPKVAEQPEHSDPDDAIAVIDTGLERAMIPPLDDYDEEAERATSHRQ